MADMVAKNRGGRAKLKLTDGQVREIRAKHARGFPPSWIASDFGVSAAYVRDIITGRVKGNYPTRHHADKPA